MLTRKATEKIIKKEEAAKPEVIILHSPRRVYHPFFAEYAEYAEQNLKSTGRGFSMDSMPIEQEKHPGHTIR